MLGWLSVVELYADKKFVINNLVGLVGLVGVENHRHSLLILVQLFHINLSSEFHNVPKVDLFFCIANKEGLGYKTSIFIKNLRI